ncbi:hypothetical protein BCR43DRAFT_454121 [Syncephalastrum racemosum]|uniref:Nuclear segregation protein Bfr1 n=1 Tax=Syncephalastrum racemosum TaxID=13706 RepID=A0A1X2HRK2_SYNRA|nr:hypothetical protein BCR43DRAFT_454121 [Syncephalastrum racemosum]
MTDAPITNGPPQLPAGVKKPNEDEYKNVLAEINANIEKYKKQQDAVKEKINKLPGKGDNSRRDQLRDQLAVLREKQAEIKKGKQEVYEQLDALNESIRSKVYNLKSFKQKVPFDSVEETDARINELESKIEAGGLRIVEEKKMIQEVNTLKRNRHLVEGLDAQQAAIDKEREIYNNLRKQVDNEESKKLSQQYEEAQAELRTIYDDSSKARDARNKLYDERTRLKKCLDDEYNKLRATRDEHRKANDAYYTFLRQLQAYKREQEKLRKQQQEQEKRQEAAQKELELASLPAFEHEITLCDNLANFLQGFLPREESNPSSPAVSTPVNEITNPPEGMVLKSKSERSEDEFYFMGGGKKKGNKGGSKQEKEKKTDTLKLPLATMEGFFEVKVTVPTKISDIPSTLEKLKERKEKYLAEQPKVTEENKKKAEAKIAAMLKKAEDEKKFENASEKNADEQEASPAEDAPVSVPAPAAAAAVASEE